MKIRAHAQYIAILNLTTEVSPKSRRIRGLLEKATCYARRILHSNEVQDAQQSQRDRAAGCVIVFAKSGRLELGDNILQTL